MSETPLATPVATPCKLRQAIEVDRPDLGAISYAGMQAVLNGTVTSTQANRIARIVEQHSRRGGSPDPAALRRECLEALDGPSEEQKAAKRMERARKRQGAGKSHPAVTPRVKRDSQSSATQLPPGVPRPPDAGEIGRAHLVPLDKIRVDGGTQVRLSIDEDVVAAYAESIEGGATLPPALVYDDGKDYWLADGFHRRLSHQRAGRESMPCVVRKGDQRRALLYAIGANHSHGLTTKQADRRRAVDLLLADPEWSKWSDRQIATMCHLTHPTVGKMRKERESKGADDPLREIRIWHSPQTPAASEADGATGKTYQLDGGDAGPEPEVRTYTRQGKTQQMRTAAIGKRKAQPVAEPDYRADDEPAASPEPAPVVDETPGAKPSPEVDQATLDLQDLVATLATWQRSAESALAGEPSRRADQLRALVKMIEAKGATMAKAWSDPT